MTSTLPKAPLTGGCQCGAARYAIDADPVRLYVCHCRECQKQSASAFGISLIVPRSGLRLTQGATRSWTRPTDSGRRLACFFCPECGTRLWHASEPPGATVSVKGGSLDQPLDLSGVAHLWMIRTLNGVVIPPDAPRHDREPG